MSTLTALPPEIIQDSNLQTGSLHWFPHTDLHSLKKRVNQYKSEGLESLRIGINCADLQDESIDLEYDQLFRVLGDNFLLQPCYVNSFSLKPSGKSLAEIVEHHIHSFGDSFGWVELWRSSQDRQGITTDKDNIFSDRIVFTATLSKYFGKQVSLGGVQPGDFEWITNLICNHAHRSIRAIGIQNSASQEDANPLFLVNNLKSMIKAKQLDLEVWVSA
ncbi:hypothetical protein PBT90_06755 [Algoriphagus halophytocola]|uniref:Uncharacterized protein n=1 Tax=Algoriphagus halophytocola TaxID=2991499 RepID=A0ABY6ML35_9BACT|nr:MULTISPECIES: hypothetical protein [unclassified Algoriphagus]UZD23092.1 hypothetical protein OM944_01075 [Algoriphagus sp. TR-M5]WBL44384.1 hypothetical protein PBT90_06755 [Algoriphagus sp. TR-M9]